MTVGNVVLQGEPDFAIPLAELYPQLFVFTVEVSTSACEQSGLAQGKAHC